MSIIRDGDMTIPARLAAAIGGLVLAPLMLTGCASEAAFDEASRAMDAAGAWDFEHQARAVLGKLGVTDLEALHPYLRIGAIESQLQGKFSVPTIFLYPGVRTGKTRLKFLGFYPEDGNYRSVHVGG